jgi:hypothetical protein
MEKNGLFGISRQTFHLSLCVSRTPRQDQAPDAVSGRVFKANPEGAPLGATPWALSRLFFIMQTLRSCAMCSTRSGGGLQPPLSLPQPPPPVGGLYTALSRAGVRRSGKRYHMLPLLFSPFTNPPTYPPLPPTPSGSGLGGLRMKFHVWGLGLPRGILASLSRAPHTLQFKTSVFERQRQLSKAPKNNPSTYLPRPLPDDHLIGVASGKRGQFWGPGEDQKRPIACCQ